MSTRQQANRIGKPKMDHKKLAYIHLNPVRNEIVQEPKEYEYSSPCTYLRKPGYLVVEDQI